MILVTCFRFRLYMWSFSGHLITVWCHSPEERSPQMAQMCLVSDRAVPEGWAGTFITPLRPSGGLMSSVLLTEFIGEFSWNINTHKHTRRQVTNPVPFNSKPSTSCSTIYIAQLVWHSQLMTLTIKRGPGLLRREMVWLQMQMGNKSEWSYVMQFVLNNLLKAESEKDVMTSGIRYRWSEVLAAALFALSHCSLCLSPPSCFRSKSGTAGSRTTPPQELFNSCSQQAPLAPECSALA